MKMMISAALAAFVLWATVTPPVYAGNCTYDSDRAADGSRCGKRSSTSRPGGS